MRSAMAIFKKQQNDVRKNRIVLIQFLIMPIMAFVMTELVAKKSADMPNSLFVTMFAAMFVGLTPLISTANAIAEDRERKSLRFLVMAGVKPNEYLLGIGGFMLLLCVIASVFFGLVGGFETKELLSFLFIMTFGSITSIILGAAIGIASKNQQQSAAISMPIFMLLSFCPMIGQFDKTVEKIATIFYTQQINVIVSDFSAPNIRPMLIILANIVVFTALFIVIYKKKGLKG